MTITRRGMVGFWRRFGMWSALAAILLAPAVFQADEKPIFSHQTHIEEGAGCADCHDLDEKALKTAFCEDCHEDGVPGTDLAARARGLKIEFPHDTHAEAAECKDCHASTIEETQTPGAPFVTSAQCFACHEENEVETPLAACAACHGADQKRVAPADHGQAWRLRHGRSAEWNALAGHGEDCGLCHTERSCRTCHLNTRPRSHTMLWRARVHGKAASWDRTSCKTCHETGTCISCHRRTPPMNHRGAWRATHGLVARSKLDTSCSACHSPGWCAACHQGGSQ